MHGLQSADDSDMKNSLPMIHRQAVLFEYFLKGTHQNTAEGLLPPAFAPVLGKKETGSSLSLKN